MLLEACLDLHQAKVRRQWHGMRKQTRAHTCEHERTRTCPHAPQVRVHAHAHVTISDVCTLMHVTDAQHAHMHTSFAAIKYKEQHHRYVIRKACPSISYPQGLPIDTLSARPTHRYVIRKAYPSISYPPGLPIDTLSARPTHR